jgi:hypothetical protein
MTGKKGDSRPATLRCRPTFPADHPPWNIYALDLKNRKQNIILNLIDFLPASNLHQLKICFSVGAFPERSGGENLEPFPFKPNRPFCN